MAGRRICAGYYRRYDSRVVYVISLDTDSGEETVIWTTDPLLGTAPPIKVLLRFRRGKWETKGQVQADDEHEDLRDRYRKTGRREIPEADA